MENNLQTLEQKETITSLELVKQINLFRQQEGNKSELEHKDLLKIIRAEFTEEIDEGNFSPISYTDKMNREKPMFVLTFSQAKQLLIRESRKVRKAVILYIEKLEEELRKQQSKPISVEYLLESALKEIKEKNLQLQEQAPKVIFANAVSSSKDTILIGELAKLIKQNGINIGQNRLFQWLRENGFLIKYGHSYNMPTQKSMELKLFEIKERAITEAGGTTRLTRTVKVTGKGQQYFISIFLKNAIS